LSKIRGTHYLSVLVLSVALIGLLVPPAAAREYSIWEWWTDQAFLADDVTPVSPPWGNAYSGWTHAQLWAEMIDKPTWTVPFAVPYPKISGKSVLHIEYAGNATGNAFGWYDTDDTSTLNEIFAGSDTAGASVEIDFTSMQGEEIGFYLNSAAGGWTFFSDPSDNNGAINDVGFKHLRVFEHPDEDDSWVLAWEDKPMYSSGYDYAAAWDESNEPLKWYTPTEPDYNDMILTFKWEWKGDRGTPELSTILLLGLSLAAVPVLRRRRR